jgi:CRP/FNR family transcriptional regulator, cyclic AMP receptor protein
MHGTDASRALLERTWYQPTARDWADVLSVLPLFERLTKRQLSKLAALATIVEFARGDLVVQAGEPGDAFHVILTGQARVVSRPRARILRTGDYFGEMALIDGRPRSATITAAGDLQTMKLPRRPFLKLLEAEPRIAIAIMTELTARIRRLEKPADT